MSFVFILTAHLYFFDLMWWNRERLNPQRAFLSSLARHEIEEVAVGPRHTPCQVPRSANSGAPWLHLRQRARKLAASGLNGTKNRFDAVRQVPQNRLAAPAHGCPPFLIERAFLAMLSLKGDNKEESAAWAWARGTSMSASSWRGSIPEDERPVPRMQ